MNERARPAGLAFTKKDLAPVQVAYAGNLADLGMLSDIAPKHGPWAHGVGLVDRTEADPAIGSPSAEAQTGGFQAGYDHPVGKNGLVGFAGGYARTNLSVDDRLSSGDAVAQQAGLYGSY